MLLENGEELNIEARVIDGAKGKFFAGRVWKKKLVDAPAQRQAPPAQDDLDDDVPF
jgi:hypothetical protein